MLGECDTLIIGGGLSGLAEGVRCQKSGEQVIVLDRDRLPGGVVRTAEQSGYRVDAGPNTLLLNDRRVMELIEDMDLSDRVVEAAPNASKRFLVKNGQVIAVPMSLIQFWKSPLFSSSSKWQLLAEPIGRKWQSSEEESLANFVRRRLGKEWLDQVVQPMVSGVYAGDPERLSVKYAMPSLYDMEQQSGSLILGMIRKMFRPAPERIKRRLISFRSGMAELPIAMALKLGESYVNRSEVREIQKTSTGWKVSWGEVDKKETEMEVTTRRLVLATPAFSVSNLPLPSELKASLQPLESISHPPVNVVAIGLDRKQVSHSLDGFGMLIPDREKQPVLGTLFSSTLFPDRAPEGKVLLTSFVGGRLHPEWAQGDESVIVERVMVSLRELIGITGAPEFYQVHRWPRAIPQMEVGYGKYMEQIREIEQDWEGLNILGNFRYGISVPQCLLAGVGK